MSTWERFGVSSRIACGRSSPSLKHKSKGRKCSPVSWTIFLFKAILMQAFGRNQRLFEPRPGGVVSLEPQPFLQCHPSAPKTQWVMLVAHGYRPSGWLERMRLLRGRFKGKGAVVGMSPFPVADSPETTPPGPGSNASTHLAKKFLHKTLRDWTVQIPPGFPLC
jgi:hypothetical protein